jgi:hypothetical protein
MKGHPDGRVSSRGATSAFLRSPLSRTCWRMGGGRGGARKWAIMLVSILAASALAVTHHPTRRSANRSPGRPPSGTPRVLSSTTTCSAAGTSPTVKPKPCEPTRKLRIYDNEDQFVTCCYDQSKAFESPDRQTASGPERTPDITNCKRNCGNIARTDSNIARAEAEVSLHKSEIDDATTPVPMRARLEQRVIALQSIIDEHRRKGAGQ